MNYVKQFLVICQTLRKNCLIVHYGDPDIQAYNKSKMYRNYVWATETEIITLTAILGITIYSYSLTPTFVGWATYGCMAFLVILIHLLCI